MNENADAVSSSPPSSPAPFRSGLIVIVLVLGLLGIGLTTFVLSRAEKQREAAKTAEDEALVLMERARKVIAEAEEASRRRRMADEMFPLPPSPFGGPPQSGMVMAQIPPPPPRMHEIPGSKELEAAEAEMTDPDLLKMRTAEGAKALEMAKAKEVDQDVIGALKHLELADQLEPNHPEVLYRMGTLFDKLGNKRRATSYFQMVAAMDERAGELATLAIHYLNGEAPEPLAGGLMHRPLRIGPAFAEVTTDDTETRTVKLSLSIRAQAGEEIDPQAVVPYIYFYDLVDGLEIMACDGEQPPVDEVNPWRSENPDYLEPAEELLDVTYHIPKKDDGAERTFFGYVVKLYYRDEIQDVLVEPRILIELLSESSDGASEMELDAILFEN